METLNLQHLSLILDQDLVLLPDDLRAQAQIKAQVTKPAPVNNPTVQPVEDRVMEEPQEEMPLLPYEGNFEKSVLIIFQGDVLEDPHREFLLKVLGAVGCSLNDVALVSTASILASSPDSIERLKPKKCLIFGSFDHAIMLKKTAVYVKIAGDFDYFFADKLEDLVDNVQLKRNLWAGLQVLFQINKQQ